MSVVVRPAESGDIDAACDFLHAYMSSKISPERWRNLLDYPWRPSDAHRGMVAIDGGRVVGFLGLISVDRVIHGRIERFCNLSAWYLMRDYRRRGLGEALLREALGNADATYTNLTATIAAAQAFRSRGFELLDAERYLLRPRPHRQTAGMVLDDVRPEHLVEGRLDADEQRIWRDHHGFNLRHLLFEAGGRICYIVLSVKKKGPGITYYELMHASDLDILADHAQTLAHRLLTSEDAVLAIDRRFLADAPSGAEIEPIRLPRLYRSRRVPPREIDHLYSEIVLLDLKLP